ncbi:MAG: trans-sulfuration enzyme family protein [Bryobacteraceae bacterium]
MKFESQVVHAGDRSRRNTTAIPSTTPIHLGTTYLYESTAQLDRIFGGEEQGFSYARYANPTNEALEELTTAIEHGYGSLATASGMAALHIAFQTALLERPHTILAAQSVYGTTVTLLDKVLGLFGAEVAYVDVYNLEALERAIASKKPGCVFLESMSNPLLRVARIDQISKLARAAGAALIVDSTFATPMLVRPLELGANIVVHSATKYLAGHGDVVGGIVVTDQQHHESLRMLSRIVGPVLGPFESYLTMRGIKTLALRFRRQCENARTLAQWLQTHPCVERVYSCSDPKHPDAETISQLFAPGLFGAMLSFEIKNANRASVMAFMDRLEMIVCGTSLGDVHTLLLYPIISSHRDLSPKMRERMGIRENLVRLAVGIESVDDIITDLDNALHVTQQ